MFLTIVALVGLFSCCVFVFIKTLSVVFFLFINFPYESLKKISHIFLSILILGCFLILLFNIDFYLIKSIFTLFFCVEKWKWHW